MDTKTKVMKTLLASLMTLCSFFAFSQNAVSKRDSDFVKTAMEHTLFEIKAAQLAQTRSSSTEVRSLASSLLAYHGKVWGELKDLGVKKQITMPSEVSEKDQRYFEKLDAQRGKDFDNSYTRCVAKAHRLGASYLKKGSEKTKDADIASWASDNYPVLAQYSTRASEVRKNLKDQSQHQVRPELSLK